MIRTVAAGAIAGAAGELALNVLSYLDMLVRARPASQMPAKVAGRFADMAGIELAKPGERPEKAETRKTAAGALMGYGTAVQVAIGYAVLRRGGLRLPLPIAGVAVGGSAMLLSDSIATAVGVTDPRTWGMTGWMLDVVPHAAYGMVTAASLELLDPLG